jgi:methylmalonyl-CoA/ethylmalonyl-CoA epimerase
MTPFLTYPIDHIGIAVTNLPTAIEWYQNFMGGRVTLREELSDQGVSLVFIETPSSKIELLTPLREGSTLARFISKRGPGMHHMCYSVPDIDMELHKLSEQGFRLIDQIPRHGAGGSKIAFIHPDSCLGVLTELVELPK